MSPSLDMNHLYFYNPSFYSSTFSYYYYIFLLFHWYTWIFLGPRYIVILISHPASCSPNTPHFFMDDAVVFYGQFPTCNITHSWLLPRTLSHIPPYQKSPIDPPITAQISTSSVSCSSQCSLCVVLRISDFIFFFKKVPYWLLHHQYLAPYPVHNCIGGIWWDKKYLNASTNENQKFRFQNTSCYIFYFKKQTTFFAFFCLFSFCMLIKVNIYKLCYLIPG